MSEPKPGSARFVPTQPRAVCRVRPLRFPSTKEIFIRARYHTDGVKHIEKEDDLANHSHLHRYLYDFAHVLSNRCHYANRIEVRVAKNIHDQRSHFYRAVE